MFQEPLKLTHGNSESAMSTRSDFLTKRTDHSSERYGLSGANEPMVIFLLYI